MKAISLIKQKLRQASPRPLIGFYHFWLAFSGAIRYGFPARRLKVIGVTGTSGKSTVVELTARLLQAGGHQVASSSSIFFRWGDRTEENSLKMTMPGRWAMQRFLARAVRSGCQYAVLEVTSEGVSQHRHRFIDFDVLVFTNLSPEHIERHGGFENYRQTKGRLFAGLAASCKKPKTMIVNVDDSQADYFLGFSADLKVGFGRKDRGRTDTGVYLESLSLSPAGTSFSFRGQKVHWPLLGEFNVMNALAAVAVAETQGVDAEISARALREVDSIPGRMEVVLADPFAVIVDYAHTAKSLQSVYETVKAGLKGKLVLVLGACGGGRDKWKRPLFGKLAAEYGDVIFLTDEDPYDENPMAIIEQVRSGIPQDYAGKCSVIPDRGKAIKKALCTASAGDAVIITGKGSETLMCLAGGRKVPWDDREAVRRLWEEIRPS